MLLSPSLSIYISLYICVYIYVYIIIFHGFTAENLVLHAGTETTATHRSIHPQRQRQLHESPADAWTSFVSKSYYHTKASGERWGRPLWAAPN